MAVNIDEDTEFNDALRAHGIIPPKPPVARTPSPPPSPTLSELNLSPTALAALADDDTLSDTEARAIESYRRKRMEEMRGEARRARFGRVYPIGREQYQREVTEASREEVGGGENERERGREEEGDEKRLQGTGVVCFLYKDGQPASQRLLTQLNTLADRYPSTKFVSIVGDKCIPNYPDRHLPTLFIYRGGTLLHQRIAWGVDAERTLEELEAYLILSAAIIPSKHELLQTVTRSHKTTGDEDELDDDDFSDDESFPRSAAAKVNGRAEKNIRQSRKDDDDDSDFDL